MRTKKLFAILMAGAMSLAMVCGPALASELPEETPLEDVSPVITPAATEEVLELATEAPVEVVTEEPTVSAEPQQPSDPTEEPAGDPTEEPAEDPTPGDPTEVPAPKMSDKYAVVEAGTKVYAERSLTTLLGTFASKQLVYISDAAAMENGAVYETRFDTEDTASGDCLVGYFYAADLRFLTEDAAAAQTAGMNSVRAYAGDKLPVADFRPVEQPADEPSQEPEIPSQEPEVPETPDEEPELPSEELEPVEEPELPSEVLEPVEEPELPAEAPAEETRSLAERIDETNPDRSIAVNVAWDAEVPAIGCTATLTMEAVGYDGLTYTVFWECDKGDGWETAFEGETSISFQVTEENVQWQWRAGVNVTGINAPAAEAAETPETEAPAEEPVTEVPAAE